MEPANPGNLLIDWIFLAIDQDLQSYAVKHVWSEWRCVSFPVCFKHELVCRSFESVSGIQPEVPQIWDQNVIYLQRDMTEPSWSKPGNWTMIEIKARTQPLRFLTFHTVALNDWDILDEVTRRGMRRTCSKIDRNTGLELSPWVSKIRTPSTIHCKRKTYIRTRPF